MTSVSNKKLVQIPRWRVVEQIQNVKDALENDQHVNPDDSDALRDDLQFLQNLLSQCPGDIPTDVDTAEIWGWLDLS